MIPNLCAYCKVSGCGCGEPSADTLREQLAETERQIVVERSSVDNISPELSRLWRRQAYLQAAIRKATGGDQ